MTLNVPASLQTDPVLYRGPVVSAIGKAALDAEESVRIAAIRALAAIATRDPAPLPLLARGLEDASPAVRIAAIDNLASARAISGDIARAVEDLKSDPDEGVRKAAAAALKGAGR